MKKKQILLIHRYYWPDTPPYGIMLKSIAECLGKADFDVSVLSTNPINQTDLDRARLVHDSSMSKINVERLNQPFPNKKGVLFDLIRMTIFSLQVFLKILFGRKKHAIMISTTPPVFGPLLASLASLARGSKFIYHCMDLHPEVGRVSGDFRSSFFFNFLKMCDQLTCKIADTIIVLSNDMKKTLAGRANNIRVEEKIKIINNFGLPFYDESSIKLPEHLLKNKNKQRVLFAGNIGRFQNLEELITAFASISSDTVELVFLGSGKMLEKLKEIVKSKKINNIFFYPQVDFELAREVVIDADICVVSLDKEMINFAYPSKTMTYLELGKPLLTSVELDSELGQMVIKNSIGICVPPGNKKLLIDQLTQWCLDKSYREKLKKNAYQIGPTLFDRSLTLKIWANLFKSVLK